VYYVCGVAISSEQMRRLQRVLVRDREAVDAGVAYAVTSTITRDDRWVPLTPEMIAALVRALDDAGGSEFDEVRAGAERQMPSVPPN
jgi:hypothetical protein